MTEPGTPGPVGRGSDFDGYQRRPENADLEGQPERDLVIDNYESQTRGPNSRTQASIGGIDPVPGAVSDSQHGYAGHAPGRPVSAVPPGNRPAFQPSTTSPSRRLHERLATGHRQDLPGHVPGLR
jgi:hypothetical protein